MKNAFKTVVSLLLVAVIGASIFVGYRKSMEHTAPPVFSNNEMLYEMWSTYKETMLEPSTGRALDRSQNNISTSESESYTMLRAAWMDDRATFDRTWKWSKDNLQRDDKLMSWRFGPLQDGSYGIQTDRGGQNTASDGDTDMALALLMAYSRWNETAYLYDAKPMIEAIWEKEVVMVDGKPVMTSNDIERLSKTSVLVNPSYFAPYAYKIFAKVDDKHDWMGLTNNSYNILLALTDDTAKIGPSKSSGLVPDWIRMDIKTGAFLAPGNNLTTDYSYDAIRTSWRLALDFHWYKDARAKQVLTRMDVLYDQWHKNGKLAAVYGYDGRSAASYESIASYGGAIGYFSVVTPDTAKEVYKRKLLPLYDADKQGAIDDLGYYDANWGWFGIALYQNALPNLTVKK